MLCVALVMNLLYPYLITISDTSKHVYVNTEKTGLLQGKVSYTDTLFLIFVKFKMAFLSLSLATKSFRIVI
jgi:hypothetical protein